MAAASDRANPSRRTCRCGSSSSRSTSPWGRGAPSSTKLQPTGLKTSRCPHNVMKDRLRRFCRSRAKEDLCACSSRLKQSRKTAASLSISTVCQVNLAGEPFRLGRTSAGMIARRLVHSRSFSVDRPVSCAAMGVVTYRRYHLLEIGYDTLSFYSERVSYPIFCANG